jgi:hypothetical protein
MQIGNGARDARRRNASMLNIIYSTHLYYIGVHLDFI